jgi:hypothetical protein
MGVNVLLNTSITDSILKDLGSRGKVRDVVYEINALTMQIRAHIVIENIISNHLIHKCYLVVSHAEVDG